MVFDYCTPTVPHSIQTGRESGLQLTEKQAVLLMQDTLPQGIKNIHALLQKRKKVVQQALNSEIMKKLMITMMGHLRGEQID